MKKQLFLCIILINSLVFYAQTTPTNTTSPNTNSVAPAANSVHPVVSMTPAQQTTQKKPGKSKAPQITFESIDLDYGIVVQGSEGTRVFKFKNTGKESLVISNCSGSCGCTVPTCPKEAFAPGKSGTIPVHYDTNRIGAFTKNVTVQTNDPTGPKVLTVHGTIEAKKP